MYFVVAISAGVGRTGAFVVIDSMLERLKHVRTIDIYGHVTCLRAQRNYMVQTEDQYVFIHDAVLEAIQSGNTEIPARGLYAHVHRMSERPADSMGGATGIQMEYRVRRTLASPYNCLIIVIIIVLNFIFTYYCYYHHNQYTPAQLSNTNMIMLCRPKYNK